MKSDSKKSDVKSVNTEKLEIELKDKLTWTVREAALCSGLGVSLIRNLAKQPDCPFSLRIGRKICIKRKEFEEYLSDTHRIDV